MRQDGWWKITLSGRVVAEARADCEINLAGRVAERLMGCRTPESPSSFIVMESTHERGEDITSGDLRKANGERGDPDRVDRGDAVIASVLRPSTCDHADQTVDAWHRFKPLLSSTHCFS